MSFEHPGLVRRLYAFGNYRFAERLAEQHHRIDSGGRVGIARWPLHKAWVDLDLVDRQSTR